MKKFLLALPSNLKGVKRFNRSFITLNSAVKTAKEQFEIYQQQKDALVNGNWTVFYITDTQWGGVVYVVDKHGGRSIWHPDPSFHPPSAQVTWAETIKKYGIDSRP